LQTDFDKLSPVLEKVKNDCRGNVDDIKQVFKTSSEQAEYQGHMNENIHINSESIKAIEYALTGEE